MSPNYFSECFKKTIGYAAVRLIVQGLIATFVLGENENMVPPAAVKNLTLEGNPRIGFNIEPVGNLDLAGYLEAAFLGECSKTVVKGKTEIVAAGTVLFLREEPEAQIFLAAFQLGVDPMAAAAADSLFFMQQRFNFFDGQGDFVYRFRVIAFELIGKYPKNARYEIPPAKPFGGKILPLTHRALT